MIGEEVLGASQLTTVVTTRAPSALSSKSIVLGSSCAPSILTVIRQLTTLSSTLSRALRSTASSTQLRGGPEDTPDECTYKSLDGCEDGNGDNGVEIVVEPEGAVSGDYLMAAAG